MSVPDLDDLRRRGVRFLALAGWLCTLVMWLLSTQLSGEHWPGLLISAVVNLLPTFCAARQRFDLSARITVGLMAAVHPAVLVYLFRDSVWQMDMHMYFFVCLAALAMLCDWRPILAGSILTAVHHIALLFVAPEWVFEGGADVERVIVHAVAVLLQFAVLAHITGRLRLLIIDQSEARGRSDQLADEARTALAAAQAAEARARAQGAELLAAAEHARSEAAEKEAARVRKAELIRIASEFETSVADIASVVSASAGQLEDTARNLNRLARDTHMQAGEASGTAEHASTAATAVAEGMTSLARSIDDIAINVNHQGELSLAAKRHVAKGDEALQILFERTKNIAEFATLIDSVAARTNMLALNATIEAVRAGEAGKGFGVVAAEVKALAQEAAVATSQITSLVSSVDAGASDAENALAELSSAVGELSGAALEIRRGVQEQLHLTNAIDSNAQGAAAVAIEMADGIRNVASVASSAGRLSAQVEDAATSLMRSAGSLEQATRSFVTHLRAA